MLKKINKQIKELPDGEAGKVSDGYHTFDELYDFRLMYNAAFFNELARQNIEVCKSKRHSDGEECFGGDWFIVIAELPSGQISNHYELKHWDLFSIPEEEKAFKWDGHTPKDVVERLRQHAKWGQYVKDVDCGESLCKLCEMGNKRDTFVSHSGRLPNCCFECQHEPLNPYKKFKRK